MARRKRREPVWPILLLIGVVAAGLGLGRMVGGPQGGPQDEAENLGELAEAVIPTPESRITIEVLNGGGVQGAASRATELLRENGFDVVYFGNESSFGRTSSVVLERLPLDGASAAAGRVLGISEVRSEPDTTRLVDLTVLLGSDWDPEAPPLPLDNLAAPDDRAWWDPRGWVPRGLLEGDG